MSQERIITMPERALEAIDGALSATDEALGCLREAINEMDDLQTLALLHITRQDFEAAHRRLKNLKKRRAG